jgi:hypothetical protein
MQRNFDGTELGAPPTNQSGRQLLEVSRRETRQRHAQSSAKAQHAFKDRDLTGSRRLPRDRRRDALGEIIRRTPGSSIHRDVGSSSRNGQPGTSKR